MMLAMPVHRSLEAGTVKALIETTCALKDLGLPFTFTMETGGSLVHHARTSLVHEFIKSDYNRLFWLDSDMEWNPPDFMRFLALSTQMEVLCGAYPIKKDPPLFMLGLGGYGEVLESNKYGCVPVRGAGLGFTVIQRKVIEELAERAPKLKYPNHNQPIARVFRCDDHDGEARGEDMAFFADIRDLGYKVWLDPSITLGHIGSKTFTGSISQFLVPADEPAEAAA